jgi:ubiquinone/menaquinone biosynthesis C-methylase UbiE
MDDTPSIVEEMQAYYGRRAPIYDESMGYTDPAAVERLARVIGAITKQLAGRTVLEIACGPGFWTQALSAVASTIAALDYNRSTLAEARRKALDWERVSLVVGDAYRLAFSNGAFDGAVAIDWLAHVPKSRVSGFLGGLHTALRPGARVVFCDQTPGSDSKTGVYDDQGNHLQERTLPDGSRYRVIKHFFSDDEFRALFSPYADHVDIERILECRRVVVGYTLRA